MSFCVNDTDGDGNCAGCARNPDASCRVNARDKALEVMFWGSPGRDDEESRAFARRLLDAVAHELAEQIRSELADKVSERLAGGVWTITTGYTAAHAADLIDPEAV